MEQCKKWWIHIPAALLAKALRPNNLIPEINTKNTTVQSNTSGLVTALHYAPIISSTLITLEKISNYSAKKIPCDSSWDGIWYYNNKLPQIEPRPSAYYKKHTF